MFPADFRQATATTAQVIESFDIVELPEWAQKHASIVEACRCNLFFRTEVKEAAACDRWFITAARSICNLGGGAQ
jgi:hypothetical protein